MSGIIAGLIGSLKTVVASIINKYFLFNKSPFYSAMKSDSLGNLYGIATPLYPGIPYVYSIAKDGTPRWKVTTQHYYANISTAYDVRNYGPVHIINDKIFVFAEDTNILLYCFDTDGNLVWGKSFDVDALGGIQSMGTSNDNNLILTTSRPIYQSDPDPGIYIVDITNGNLTKTARPLFSYSYYHPVQSSSGVVYAVAPWSGGITKINAAQTPIRLKSQYTNDSGQYPMILHGLVIDNSDYLYTVYRTIPTYSSTVFKYGVVKINPTNNSIIWHLPLADQTYYNGGTSYNNHGVDNPSIIIDKTNGYLYVYVQDHIAKIDLDGNLQNNWYRKLTSTATPTTFNSTLNLTGDNDLIFQNTYGSFGPVKISQSIDTFPKTITSSFSTLTYNLQSYTGNSITISIGYLASSSSYLDGGFSNIGSNYNYISGSVTATKSSLTLDTTVRDFYV
jgi:hypothetical protein